MDALFKSKPPISKAKMSSITKAAMKSIKMYKHVVQAVEKFITKVRLSPLSFQNLCNKNALWNMTVQFGFEKEVYEAHYSFLGYAKLIYRSR